MAKNIFSTEALVEWLENQPARKRYDYCDFHSCACAQYAKHIGVKYHVTLAVKDGSFWEQAEWIAVQKPRTFGAAARRARALLEQEQSK